VFKKQFSEVEDACALAQAIVDTVREPLIVLDKDLRAIAASRSFYVKFTTNPDDTGGKHLYELGHGEWDIPKLRLLLEKIIPDHGTMDDYEVDHDFPRIGKRVIQLNARVVVYLSTLCGALTHSMIGDGQSISLKVIGKGGSSTCANAESLGLIVTELVINALKHAFNDKTTDGQIAVAYDVSGTDWKLSVADNGVGKPDGVFAQPKSGLGTGIVKALAKQLDSQVVTSSGPKGTTVSVTHATFAGREERLEAVH
jgi:signal transduction histidine kinase